MPHLPPTYPAQFIFIGTALRGERAPKCLKQHFRLNTLPFDAKSPWRIPYDELPPLVSGVSSLRWQKWKEPGPGEGVNVSILPSARFLLSGEEIRSAPWVKWNPDVIVICVFLEDSVTTEKRLQQVRVIHLAHATLVLTRVFSQSLPDFSELPPQTQLVVVGFRLQPLHAAELGITDCDMNWEEANDLLSKAHSSVTYFAQVPTTLDQAGEHLYQLLTWLVARRIKRLPLAL